MKAWIKGGLIGLGIVFMGFILSYICNFAIAMNGQGLCGFIGAIIAVPYSVLLLFSSDLIQMKFLNVYFIPQITGFLIGALIGWLIGKFKR